MWALLAVGLVTVVFAHLSHLPGPFVKDGLEYEGPEAPNGTCETAFSLGGHNYNVSVLQIQVGGYIAYNNVRE